MVGKSQTPGPEPDAEQKQHGNMGTWRRWGHGEHGSMGHGDVEEMGTWGPWGTGVKGGTGGLWKSEERREGKDC